MQAGCQATKATRTISQNGYLTAQRDTEGLDMGSRQCRLCGSYSSGCPLWLLPVGTCTGDLRQAALEHFDLAEGLAFLCQLTSDVSIFLGVSTAEFIR